MKIKGFSGKDSSVGFSLIEVLVSMTVLIVIIVMVTNMFRNASEAWDTGTQRAEMNTSARAAVEYITRELSCAVVGTIPDSQGNTLTLKKIKLDNDADDNVANLSFVALSGEANALRGVKFRFNKANRIIETVRETDSSVPPFQPYTAAWSAWPVDPPLLITNVWRFEANIYESGGDMQSGHTATLPYDSSVLPACVDISIEMLNERDMVRALSLTPGPQQNGFVMTNSRVYTTRVSFPNRSGER